MENKLPGGWVKISIGEILVSRKGKKPSSTINYQKEGYIPYILIDELEGNTPRFFTNDNSVSYVRKKDVLLVWDGSIGKCGSGLEGAIGSTLVSLTPLDDIPTKFLEYLIKFVNPFIKETSTGTGLQHINKSFFRDCFIPLPPFAEQYRIVAKLDALMVRIQTCCERLEKIPVILKRFRQSVLAAAVSGELTEEWRETYESSNHLFVKQVINFQKRKKARTESSDLLVNKSSFANSWVEIKLQALFEDGGIFDGPFGSNLKTDDYVEKGIRVIRLENIGYLEFIEEKKTFITEEKYQTLKRHTVKEGDIIISSFISDCVRTVMLPSLNTRAIAKADCFCLRPCAELIDREFLVFLLSSQLSYEKLL